VNGSDRGARQRILDVALELFLAHGFEKTSIRDIAARAQFTGAGIYYHFRSKDDLLKSLVEPFVACLDDIVEMARPDHSRSGRRALLGAYLDLLIDQRAVARFVATDVAVLHHPDVGRRIDDLDRRFRALLAGPGTGPAGDVIACAAMGALWRPVVQLPEVDVAGMRPVLLRAATNTLRTARR
jgi:AcrR family transcriptional regulator